MRRVFATFLLTISLFIGAMAWSGFLILNTVLDPGRSERMATTLLDDPDVREQITANISRTLDANIPPEAGLPPGAAAAAADAALDSPAVQALVFDALVASHQALLGEGEAPRAIDGGAFGSAARDALVAQYPQLDGVLPAAPSLEIPLPTERIPDLGPVRDGLEIAVPAAALVAAVGAVLALVITSNRPSVLRRAGIWAIGLAAFGVAIAFGIPALAQRFLPDQAAIISGVIGAMAETTRLPALAMALAGIAGVALSFLWRPAGRALVAPQPSPQRESQRGGGARQGERARRRSGGPPVGQPRFDVQPPNRPRPPGERGEAPVPQARSTPAYGTPTTAPARPATPPAASAPSVDATRVEAAMPSAPARPDRAGARWVDDIGWIHDGDGPIPPGARFVPGAGYVLPD